MLHKYMGKTSLKGGTPIETLRFICSLHMGDDYILWFFTNVSCQFIPASHKHSTFSITIS